MVIHSCRFIGRQVFVYDKCDFTVPVYTGITRYKSTTVHPVLDPRAVGHRTSLSICIPAERICSHSTTYRVYITRETAPLGWTISWLCSRAWFRTLWHFQFYNKFIKMLISQKCICYRDTVSKLSYQIKIQITRSDGYKVFFINVVINCYYSCLYVIYIQPIILNMKLFLSYYSSRLIF